MSIRKFLADDRGASDMVATLLKVAFIVVPLAILLILFRDEIKQFAQEIWDDMMSKGKSGSK